MLSNPRTAIKPRFLSALPVIYCSIVHSRASCGRKETPIAVEPFILLAFRAGDVVNTLT